MTGSREWQRLRQRAKSKPAPQGPAPLSHWPPAGPGGEEKSGSHVLATRLHLDRRPLLSPALPSSPHILTCQRNSLTSVSTRHPQLSMTSASQTHRPPRCPPRHCPRQSPFARAKRLAHYAQRGTYTAKQGGRSPPAAVPAQARRLGRYEPRGPHLRPRDAALLGPRPPPCRQELRGKQVQAMRPMPRHPLCPFFSLLLFWPQAVTVPASLHRALHPDPGSQHLRGSLCLAILCTWPRPGCPPVSPAPRPVPEPPPARGPLVQAVRGRPP